MTSLTGLSPNNPTRYLGASVAINTVVTRNRAPTGADYRMPETGKLYPFNTFWLVGKDPTTGTQGDLWYLSKIEANIAYWLQLSSEGSTGIFGVNVDAFTPPGTNPVLPDPSHLITVTGGQVAASAVGTNVIRTDSLAPFTFTIEIQRTQATPVSTLAANGVSHFDSNQFIVDANGYVQIDPALLVYYSLTPYIVGPDVHSEFATISAAVAQAIADGASTANPKNIHIKPQNGGYVEDVVLVDGINLVGQGDQVTIHGKISMSTAGEGSISNLTLKTNGDYCVSVTGSAATDLTIFNCNLYATNHTAMQQASTNPLAIIPINNCFYFIQDTGITVWDMTGAGFISQVECSSGNEAGSTTPSNNSAGVSQIFNCVFDFPISSSGTGSLNLIDGTYITGLINVTALTFNGTGVSSVSHSIVAGGTAPAVEIGVGATCAVVFIVASSSNTNVLTGAGTMTYAFIAFTGASSGHNVAVETAFPTI